MPVAKGRRQLVLVDRPAALAGRPAVWRGRSFVGETAAFSYRIVGQPDALLIREPSAARIAEIRALFETPPRLGRFRKGIRVSIGC
jgi:hypothetical protein